MELLDSKDKYSNDEEEEEEEILHEEDETEIEFWLRALESVVSEEGDNDFFARSNDEIINDGESDAEDSYEPHHVYMKLAVVHGIYTFDGSKLTGN